ncbi:hypothetical protein [Alicyclobacillus fodiniaquatilis]|uniref:Uncharacterized protein n=1 Tax=Alicyclobacillus fodiniaquatilis TaxID=1661150 RepID=A0ABW4JN56_9BACL
MPRLKKIINIYAVTEVTIVAFAYTWCIALVDIYQTSDQSGRLLYWYIIAYFAFILFTRSTIEVIVMNILSIVSLPFVFLLPQIQEAGPYMLEGEPYIQVFGTLLALCIQLPLYYFVIRPLRRKWVRSRSREYRLIAVLFTLVFVATIFVLV